MDTAGLMTGAGLTGEAGPMGAAGFTDAAALAGRAGSTVRHGSPLTLAEEHVLLLSQVTARAEELLAAAAAGRWPAAELAALAGYAQAEVVRQAADEEALLFPAVAAQQATRLARDHARLRAAAELLVRATDGEQPLSPAQVTVAVRDFVTQFRRHLHTEEGLLASGRPRRGVPGTGKLGGRLHEWYPLTEGSVIDLDVLPPRQAVAAAADRLLRMRRGEQVELVSGTDLAPVWREISELSPDGYRFTVTEDGPPRWRMRVTRREPAGAGGSRREPAGAGGPRSTEKRPTNGARRVVLRPSRSRRTGA